MIFQKLKTEGTSEVLGIRRNDYIASIRSDIADISAEINAYQDLKRQCYELIQYCKDNKLRKFCKVAKKELQILERKHKFHLKYKKELEDLLVKADRYAPGARRE